MSWDTEFYAAPRSDATFLAGINSLAFEYKADAVAPFATYQEINASDTIDLSGASKEGYRLIQLTVWAATPTSAKDLAANGADGVRATFGKDVSSVFGRSLGRDPEEELFGYAYDFEIWFQNP